MGIFKQLDIIISDYVGFNEVEKDGELIDFVCANPALHESITKECTSHFNDKVPLDKLSKDAQYCIQEWESLMKDFNCVNYAERSDQ